MRAILTVPVPPADDGPAVCPPLFPLLDRPFVQHVVEALAERGVSKIDFVLGRGADAVEEFLGTGARWGCSFSYHLTRDPERPGRLLAAVAAACSGPLLIGRTDRLPPLPARLPGSRPPVLFVTAREWTGWAVADAADLAAAPPSGLGRHLAARGAEWVGVGPPVRLRSLADVPAAQDALLRGPVSGAREVRPGVWFGRRVRAAATAEFVPPVFVGESTAVGPEVRLGPNAAVGAGCLLDCGAAIRVTTVLAATYVGPGVELDGVIVEGSRLTHPERGTVVTVDDHLLGPVGLGSPVATVACRALAAVGVVLTLPVVAAAAAWLRLTRRGPVFWRRRFVRTPCPPGPARETGTAYTLVPPRPGEDERGWVIPPTVGGLVLELLPALAAVARGDLRLVGLPPRTAEQFEVHARQCPSLFRAPAGLVTETALCDPASLAPDESLLVDSYQAHAAGRLADAGRLGRFLFRLLAGRGASPATTPEQPAACGLPRAEESVERPPGSPDVAPDTAEMRLDDTAVSDVRPLDRADPIVPTEGHGRR